MIIVNNVPKDLRVPIKKVLPGRLVIEELALGAAQQRVRILFQCVAPRLELATGHIDQHLLILGRAPILEHWWRW